MDKYRKVIKPKDTEVKDEAEIRVTAVGSVSAYVSRAAKVFNELEKPMVTITGTGNAITKAVSLAEVVKRRFKGLHQITSIGSTEIVDEYEPLEEGLDKVSETRTMSTISIKLSKDSLDSSDKGYQAPLDDSEIKEYDPEELTKNRGRGRGGGKGRGKSSSSKGKGEGKGKSKDKSTEKGKGKGKSKDKSPEKGKGKGKSKDKSSEKGKGKGKGKDDSPAKGKGKGKGKGKEYDEPKGKGKGKSKSKSKYDDYYEEPKGKSKGKGKDKGKGKGKYDEPKGKGKGKGKYDYGYDDYYPPVRASKGYGKDKGKGKGKRDDYYNSW